MKVTAWNNGSYHQSGAGYGLKISAIDRDRHFKKAWKSVLIGLPDGSDVEVNTNKASFWNDSCRELISKEIGAWLIERGYAPWPMRAPPTFELEPVGERRFALHEREA